MGEDAVQAGSSDPDGLDFDEEFIQVDALICEYDSVGEAQPRKAGYTFQWAQIENSCYSLLKKERDVRVAIWYIRACMARRGIPGLAESIRMLADIMSLPIEQIHPRAQPGELPCDALLLHLNWLLSPQFLHQFGNAQVVEQGATLSALASGDVGSLLESNERRDTAVRFLSEAKESLLLIEKNIKALEREFDVSGMSGLIDRALARLKPAEDPKADSVQPAVQVNDTGERERDCRLAAGGTLTSRKDVEATLQRLAEYFRVYEPSHPAPIFLARIQRMLGAQFGEVMAELYADGTALAAQIDRPNGAIK
ncbi:type VI secretion system protein TssA [Burkholderia sp. TSV86]|uniref:type VI secretion system protein TssA n=1 Tax=Burkholderia sp. TSV86 TaxID=1385594 RepID=UPI00075734CD|nr:type VI secretion system ImpA family N-terminal domain-containing protein [Burkholderia sp. TSV86]KVE33795.1 hypothetical protein WS68_11550 [Burkholderia sp. TSV86]